VPPAQSPDAGLGRPDPFIGRKLGPYRLVNRLGRGSNGLVYIGEDTLLARQVAVKILSPDIMDADKVAIERFIREARAAASIEHPNVVGIFGIGQESGVIYIAMQIVVGGSAAARVGPDGTFDALEATRVVKLAARGLAAAHARGIIHRDVKPGNILIGDNGEVKVADFGMAKFLGNLLGTLTDKGATLGTPHYMSPEQCMGKALDGRADVYSLGATYFKMLTGRTPYPDDAAAAVFYKQIQEPHPDPASIKPDVPFLCTRVIDRAMEKHPDDRFQSAAEMASALEAVEESLRRDRQSSLEADRLSGGDTMVLDEQSVAAMLDESDSDSNADMDGDPDADSAASVPAAPPPRPSSALGASRMPGLPQSPGASRAPPTATGPVRGPGAAAAAAAAAAVEKSQTPVEATFKIAFPTVPDAKAALAGLRPEIRNYARKIIAPASIRGRKVTVLEVGVNLRPADLLAVGRVLLTERAEFLGVKARDLPVQQWLGDRLDRR
jgi:serine/threonine protein kinase